ncbi:MAG: hypothetical protein WD100_10615 [Tistlia sp.]|uniref:hypothetical protein n=1 Tax=Tistlia sp. TaxID=3057121 RepID=UPI0034A22B97
MRKAWALIALVLLAACATEAKYQTMLESWVGVEERQLVQAWGPPDSVYEGEDARYLTWNVQYQNYLPGSPPHYRSRVVGNRVYTVPYGGMPGHLVTSRCKTTFALVEGRVTGWRAEGNACRQ